MEAKYSSQTSTSLQTTRCYNSEDHTLCFVLFIKEVTAALDSLWCAIKFRFLAYSIMNSLSESCDSRLYKDSRFYNLHHSYKPFRITKGNYRPLFYGLSIVQRRSKAHSNVPSSGYWQYVQLQGTLIRDSSEVPRSRWLWVSSRIFLSKATLLAQGAVTSGFHS
jgi:hypothetical protein